MPNPVLSFTLFGSLPKYYIGAEKNLLQAKEMLPDWEVRIYYSKYNILTGYEDKLRNLGANLIDVSDLKIGEKRTNEFPYFWRFMAFFEDVPVIVRDLDSRLSNREINYINGWLNSGKDYFIIRDHPWHSPVPAGLFGIKRKINEFENHFVKFIGTQNLGWGSDQTILHQYMERIDKNNIYYCGFDNTTNYIPRDDENFFIGMQVDENDLPITPNATVSLKFLSELGL